MCTHKYCNIWHYLFFIDLYVQFDVTEAICNSVCRCSSISLVISFQFLLPPPITCFPCGQKFKQIQDTAICILVLQNKCVPKKTTFYCPSAILHFKKVTLRQWHYYCLLFSMVHSTIILNHPLIKVLNTISTCLNFKI